jgi:DNA-binding CsgD family transcriptional regulator
VPGKVPRGSLLLPSTLGFATLARAVLDKLDRGVVLLDPKGKVVDSNTIGRDVLANGSGLVVRNDRLAFTDPAIDGRFSQLLEANGKAVGKPGAKSARSTGLARGVVPVVAATVKRAGAASCRVLVTPLTVNGEARIDGYLALIYAPAERRDIASEVLVEIYRLTRAQADVARQLYAGRSVEATAVQLKLSLNTVRTHLKHIFSKCEVQSQAELMYTLALGPQRF